MWGGVLRLGDLEDEDGDSDNNKGGRGMVVQRQQINGKKCDKEVQEEVGDKEK